MSTDVAELKRRAAQEAVAVLESGMAVGLGTGSTAVQAVRVLGRELAMGRLYDVVAVATSEETANVAMAVGIPLTSLNEMPVLDVTIDGADEIDPELNLIKGLGGALLREKIVAAASKQFLIVADESKRVEQLGEKAPVPVEVIPLARRRVAEYLSSLGARVEWRMRPGTPPRPFVTDEGNHILDCFFGLISDPTRLAWTIRAQPGVVEHGLFLAMANRAFVASAQGVTVLER